MRRNSRPARSNQIVSRSLTPVNAKETSGRGGGSPTSGPRLRRSKSRNGEDDDRLSLLSETSSRVTTQTANASPTSATRSLAQLRMVVEDEEETMEEWQALTRREQSLQAELQQSLVQVTAEVDALKAAEGVTQAEFDDVKADARVLAHDLPQLLEKRGSELQSQTQRIEALVEESSQRRSREAELSEERGMRHEELDELWHELQQWRAASRGFDVRNRRTSAHCLALSEGCSKNHSVSEVLETQMLREANAEERQAEALVRLAHDVSLAQDSFAEARREQEDSVLDSHEKLESSQLAKTLEVEGLQRTLQLLREQCETKAREAVWWRHIALDLEREHLMVAGNSRVYVVRS